MVVPDNGSNCTLQALRHTHSMMTKKKGRSAHLPAASFPWGNLLGFHSTGLESDLNVTGTQFLSLQLGNKVLAPRLLCSLHSFYI